MGDRFSCSVARDQMWVTWGDRAPLEHSLGFTAGLYECFFELLGNDLIASFNEAQVKVGSISSSLVNSRSLPHTTAGSLVYPLYFLTNHREACSNRAGFSMADISADEFSSFVKCVLECCQFVRRERCFSFTANGFRKIRNFQSFPIIWFFDSMLRYWVWFTSYSLATSLLNSLTQDRPRVLTSIAIHAAFIRDEQNERKRRAKKDRSWGRFFHVVLGTIYVSLTDGYPYLQVQLTGKLQKALAEF